MYNGIEYGMMAAYAEGLNILHQANVDKRSREFDAETAPMRDPEHYQYDFNLPDNKLLSAMRMQFGGHEEQHAETRS